MSKTEKLFDLSQDKIESEIQAHGNSYQTYDRFEFTKDKKSIVIQARVRDEILINWLKSQGYNLAGFEDFEKYAVMIFHHP